jgi:hypothetical protein
MNAKDQFLDFGNFILQNGAHIRFWEDKWRGDSTLKEQYPNLYNIVRNKSATVANIFSTRPLNISFRRSLVDANLQSWHNLVLRIADIQLTDQTDIFRWSLNSSGQFSVSSMYQAMLDSDIIPHNIFLWKLKIPLKVKVFLWLLFRKEILTKDNLVKRNWHRNEQYCFCQNYETIQHLFFDCKLAKFIWTIIYFTFGLEFPVSINSAWTLNMNSRTRKLVPVGIGTMLWSMWLSRNDIAFDKKTYLILYAGNIQGYILDQDMVIVIEGGRAQKYTRCMPSIGNSDNENLC